MNEKKLLKISFAVGDFVIFYDAIKLVGKVITVDELQRKLTVLCEMADLNITLSFDSVTKIFGKQLEVVQQHEIDRKTYEIEFQRQIGLLKEVDNFTLIYECKRRLLMK